jgi:hypothetical protein
MGKRSINIANFSLGRNRTAKGAKKPVQALAVVHVDEIVPEAVLKELGRIPAMQFVRAVKLN